MASDIGHSCCKKRVTSFDEFLTLPGCTSGSHSTETVSRPAPVSTAPAVGAVSVPMSVDAAGVETYGTLKSATPAPVIPPPALEEKKPEPLEQDDPSVPVQKGTKCRRLGCNAEHISDEVSRGNGPGAICVFHPGYGNKDVD
jgi:CHORD